MHDLADMQTEAELDRRGVTARGVQVGQPVARVVGRFDRGLGGTARAFATTFDREDGEHGIADEAQDFAVVGEHRACGAFEVAVEQIDVGARAERFSKPGGTAQVGIPDHRIELAPVTALDLAVEHLAPGVLAKEGTQHVVCDLSPDLHLAGDGQPFLNTGQIANVVARKARFPVGCPGPEQPINGRIDVLILGKGNEITEVVGRALALQRLERVEVQRRGGTDEAPAQERNAVLEHGVHRAGQPLLR